MTKKTIIYILLFIISLLPRSMELFSDNNYFGFEQGLQYLITKEIFVDHKITMASFQGGFGDILKPAGFNYLLGIPFILASGNPFVGRIFMFAISSLTILLAIILTNRMFKPITAFFICLLLTISSNMYHLAGRMDTPAFIPILIVLLIFLVSKILSGNKKILPLAAFVIGLTAHFEMATSGKLIPLFMVLLVYLSIKKTISYRYFFISVIFLIIPLLPLLIFDLSHNFQNIHGVLKLFEASGRHVRQDFALLSLNVIANRLDVFRWNFLSTFSPHFLIWPLILLWILAGSFIYLRKKISDLSEKKLVFILVTIPFVYFIMLIFYPANIVQWWLFELGVFYCFLVGIIFGYFWNKKYFRFLIILTLIILFSAFIHRIVILYQNEFVFYSSVDKYIHESEPIRYIFDDAKKNTFSIKIFSSHPSANYDYLIWWYETNKYDFMSDTKYGNIIYMLFERDYLLSLGDEKLSKILEVGTVMNTKVFKSGFIIKKVLVNNTYLKQ